MANSTLLCIHRDPCQLSLLRENGYELATATTGSDGLRLFMSQPVDAVVLEYHGLLDGGAIADEIKQVRPEVPIVMLADHVELPASALKSMDALVVKSDGPHFLLATVHFILNVKPAQRHKAKLSSQTAAHVRRPGKSRAGADDGSAIPGLVNPGVSNSGLAIDGTDIDGTDKDAPFSQRVWRGIQNGTIQF